MILEEMQKEIFSKLSPKFTVYDYVPENPNYPYIYVNDMLMLDNDCKDKRGYDINIYLNIVSTYKGKKEIYNIAEVVLEELRNINIDNYSINFSRSNLSVRAIKTGINDGLVSIRYKIVN